MTSSSPHAVAVATTDDDGRYVLRCGCGWTSVPSDLAYDSGVQLDDHLAAQRASPTPLPLDR